MNQNYFITTFAFSLFLFSASFVFAAETIEKIEVRGNENTERSTIIRVSELQEGAEVTNAMLLEAKNLVSSAGVFESVDVKSRVGSDPQQRIVTIEVKEKTTWFAVPALSFSQTGFSGGGVVGETNLFGSLKKAALFGDWGPDIKRIAGGYRDPGVFGSIATLSIDGIFRIDDMAEYFNRKEKRKVRVKEFGGTFLPGIRLTENVTTSLGIYYRNVRQRIRQSDPFLDDRDPVEDRGSDIAIVAEFDFKNSKNIDGLMKGTEVKLSSQFSDDRYFSDYDYTKQLIYVKQGFLFLDEKANFITKASVQLGKNLPYYIELMSGGDNLRGYLNRQFRGDTKYTFNQEVMLPIYDFKRFILRATAFWDNTMIYFKDQKDGNGEAFTRDNWHNGIGVGIRTYLKGIAVPLFGMDFARGLEDEAFAYYISVGAVF